jgi:tRNA-specific 2-thiouridylase
LVKAVGLFSAGLDSILATKLMLDQSIEVFAVNFLIPFCTRTRKIYELETKQVAKELGVKLKTISLDTKFVELVKNPKHGYGKNMNPCIDCRILMLRLAKHYMEKMGASFVFTGEVLGERPMSQKVDTMRIIERESSLDGRLLRPLSAKLLKPTMPELEGLVDREKLLAIQGRSRKPQIALAQKFGIKDYPNAAGGCRLTDPSFAKRIKDAFQHKEDSLKDIELLKYGRHFRLPSGAKVLVGRNEDENETILKTALQSSTLFEVRDAPSPITLLAKAMSEEDIKFAASICLRYSDHKDIEGEVHYWKKKNNAEKIVKVKKIEEDKLVEYRI